MSNKHLSVESLYLYADHMFGVCLLKVTFFRRILFFELAKLERRKLQSILMTDTTFSKNLLTWGRECSISISGMKVSELCVWFAVPRIKSRYQIMSGFLAKGLLPRVSLMIKVIMKWSPGICLTAEENPGRPQVGDRLMKGLCDQSSPQMVSLTSKCGQ